MDTQQILGDPDFVKLPFQEKAKVLSAVDPDFAGLPAGEKTKALYSLMKEPPLETQAAKPTDEPPAWAAAHPNLYGALGAGKALLRTGLEAGGTTAGAAGGAMIPVPGSTLIGAGGGYAIGKRAADAVLGENVDMSAGGIAKDVGVGAVMQGAGSLIGKLPFVKNILSPAVASVGPQKPVIGTESLAESTMEKAMKVPPSVKAEVRDRAIGTALREQVPVTPGGLNRVKGLLDDLEAKMDSAVAANPNAPITTDSVLGPVKELQTWAEKTVNGKELSAKVQGVINRFKKQYGDEITVAQAQELKQNTNAFLRKSYGELKPVTVEAQKQVVRGLKDRIAQEIPEITGVNARYSDLKVLESALERAVNRTGNWDWFSLSAGMAGAIVGGATGNVAKAGQAVVLWRALKSPFVQSRLALVLKKYGAGSKANAMANTIADTIYQKSLAQETTAEEQ